MAENSEVAFRYDGSLYTSIYGAYPSSKKNSICVVN